MTKIWLAEKMKGGRKEGRKEGREDTNEASLASGWRCYVTL